MAMDSILARFEGDDGHRRLVDQLRKQLITGGDSTLASEIAGVAQLLQLSPGEILIRQDAADNDLFLIISGSFRVVVNGREVAIRCGGEHVGEMAIVDPSAARSASVVAAEASIVVKMSEPDFVRIAEKRTELWRAVAVQLSRRLNERRRFHPEPNVTPILFIGSSSEQLPIAQALKAAVPDIVAQTVLWSEDVFAPSHFTMDDLDAQIRPADFAVLVLGADDKVLSRGLESDAPRDNVVFELGLFMGALSRFRTFLLVPKGTTVKLPSDLLGITCVHYDGVATDPVAAIKSSADEIIDVIRKKGPK
jgi:CRP/FNR family transcriptional regulator, cyclic AMP receptor protein